jgi:hypothetical protein
MCSEAAIDSQTLSGRQPASRVGSGAPDAWGAFVPMERASSGRAPRRTRSCNSRVCRTWMAPSAQQRYLWNRDLPLRANRDLPCSTVPPGASSVLGGVRAVRHSARRRVVRAATGASVFVLNLCLLRNGAFPDRASSVVQPAVNRQQPSYMRVDAKFVDAPYQLAQLTGTRDCFPQHLMEIMRDLPDPLRNRRGIKAAGGT